MFWFWSSYLAASLVTQVTLTSLAGAIRSFLSIGRLAAGPAGRFCSRTLIKGSNPYWSKNRSQGRRLCRFSQDRKPLFIVTEDFEYMVISLARKQWKKRLAFIDRNYTATIKVCSLLRRDDGELRWSEHQSKSIASLGACPESGALVATIHSGLIVLSATQTSLLSLGVRGQSREPKISKKQTSSVLFDATSCACHIGNDALAAIGHTSRALALFRNRHNSWNLVNTTLPVQTINSQLTHNGTFLYHMGGRMTDSGLLSACVFKLQLPPTNLPLGVRLRDFQCAQWALCAPLPEACERMAAISLGRAIILFGGVNAEERALKTVLLYDTDQDTWIYGRPLQHERFDASCIRMGNYIVIMNGLNGNGKAESAIEAIHITNLLSPINGGESSDIDEAAADIDDDPWLTLGDRSDNLNCKVALLSEDLSQRVEKASSAPGKEGVVSVVRPILLTSDSETLEDGPPRADDPLSWFYA